MNEELVFSDLGQLRTELTKVFESGALFRTLRYSGDIHKFSSTTSNYVNLPKQITRACEQCKMSTIWECGNTAVDISSVFNIRTYQCRN